MVSCLELTIIDLWPLNIIGCFVGTPSTVAKCVASITTWPNATDRFYSLLGFCSCLICVAGCCGGSKYFMPT